MVLDLELLAQLVHHAIVQVGSIVSDEHLWHSVAADNVILHKPGDCDLSDILEGTCLHPLGKIVDGPSMNSCPLDAFGVIAPITSIPRLSSDTSSICGTSGHV